MLALQGRRWAARERENTKNGVSGAQGGHRIGHAGVGSRSNRTHFLGVWRSKGELGSFWESCCPSGSSGEAPERENTNDVRNQRRFGDPEEIPGRPSRSEFKPNRIAFCVFWRVQGEIWSFWESFSRSGFFGEAPELENTKTQRKAMVLGPIRDARSAIPEWVWGQIGIIFTVFGVSRAKSGRSGRVFAVLAPLGRLRSGKTR